MCYPLFIVWETHVLFISISSETVEFHICMWSKLNILEKSHTGLFLSLLFFFFLNWTLSHPLLISLLHCHLLKPVRHGFSSPDMFTFRSVTGLNYYNFLNIRTSVSTTKVGCKFLLLFMLLFFFSFLTEILPHTAIYSSVLNHSSNWKTSCFLKGV